MSKYSVIVYFDLAIGERSLGRLEIELFAKEVPRTVENFRALCTGERGLGISGAPLHFKGCVFHRVISGFMAQCGDFTNNDGTGGESIYGRNFADENFIYKHDRRGLLSMANAGPNTNGSQFFITFKALSHLDSRHVVFGSVTKGHEILSVIEKCATDSNDRPKIDIIVADCGQVKSENPPIPTRGLWTKAHKDMTALNSTEDVDQSINKNGSDKPSKDVKAVQETVNQVVQVAVSTDEQDVDADSATQGMTSTQKRLFLLRMKINQGRKANKAEVELEFRRKKDPKFADRQEAYEKSLEKRAAGLDPATAGRAWGVRNEDEDMSLQLTSQQAEWLEGAAEKKEARMRLHGQNATKDDKWYATYQKSLKKLPSNSTANNADEIGSDINANAEGKKRSPQCGIDERPNGLTYGSDGTVSASALERLGRYVQEKEQVILQSKQKRRKIEMDTTPAVNAKNEAFNKAASQAFDKYTLEIRQNLERGSAI